MAASSSSVADWYDVFIYHQGVDVKRTFARSLYLRLLERGFRAFLDPDELQSGYCFLSQRKNAIKTAPLHVAIFSPRYAESQWCLDALELMLESKALIIPVFYRVTPAEVRWTGKDGKYAQTLEGLAKKRTHEGTLRYDSTTIENWRNALSRVADNSGFELEVCNGEELELELLDKMVKCLSKILEKIDKMVKCRSKILKKPDLDVSEYPTGLDYMLKDFEHTVLQQQSGKPQILGIAGLGGVGKTTLAKHFFNIKKSDYVKSCFLSDIKVQTSINSLQSQLFKSLTGLHKEVKSVDEGKEMLIEPLKSFNVLVILDDVDHVNQVRALLPVETHDLRSWSLILITSRHKNVLKSARVERSSIYELTGLNKHDSRQLFCFHAFKSKDPLPGFGPLIDKFVEYCGGLPLSLKVIGAQLYGKEISEWEGLLHASSASAASTSISNYGYDVFINHHGPDVKRTFASHLYHRLVFYGLRPFLDNEEMQEGDNMAIQIEEAIATASVHVAIFSRRYAESHGCLDELLLMLESGVPVFPVFYNVKPWTKGKDGVYGRALQNHENKTMYDSQADEEKRRYNSNKIEKWRMALDRISEISGLELEAFEGDEAELLDNVVKSVLKSVRKAPLYVVENLIGLDEKVEDFENTVLLQRQSGKPQVVGLVGLGGVGKTTLAKELINRKSSSFSRTCFLFDVRKTVARSSLHFLQSKLFKDLTNMNIQIESVTQGIELFTKHISSIGATAFVILDDVDNVHQLEALLPVQNFLPSKSLILITSRSEDVLTRSGVEQSSIYNLTDKWQYSSLAKYPTRWDRKVKDFADTVLLQQQSEELKVVGIVGLAGIGKTRLATEFFIRKSSDYRRSYFLYDVTENARTSCSLHTLQSKLLRGLTQLDLQVEGEDEGMDLFKKHVSYFQSLVILDNVDHWNQLHALLSVLSVLPSGSLILITSRDRDVLNLSGVQESSIYELTGLNTEDSLELFCTHAFGQPSPRPGFEDLVDKFLRHCNGLPLTLKVFGALLWGEN